MPDLMLRTAVRDQDGNSQPTKGTREGLTETLSSSKIDVMNVLTHDFSTGMTEKTSDGLELNVYKEVEFFIDSTANQNFRLAFTISGVTPRIMTSSLELVAYSAAGTNAHTIPSGTIRGVPLSSFPILKMLEPTPYKKYLLPGVRIILRHESSSALPTTGTVTIRMKGVRN